MNISIHIECPNWVKTAAKIAAPVVFAATAGVAFSVPKTFTSGETLAAADLNANFATIPTMTDWVSYTPAVSAGASAIAANPQQGSSLQGAWRRVGDSAEVVIAQVIPNCTTGTTAIHWSLPPSLHIDMNKLPGQYPTVGSAFVSGNATTMATTVTTDGVIVGVEAPPNYGGLSCATLGNGGNVDMRFTIPIQSWAFNN
jgi:hypothetical protein